MCAPDSLIFSLRQAACLALLTPLIALAQGPVSTQDAANPYAPVAPLVHLEMTPLPRWSDAPTPNAWRAAHDAVAASPRGHADIVAWEEQAAANQHPAPAGVPPPPVSPPHSGHRALPMHHPMPMVSKP